MSSRSSRLRSGRNAIAEAPSGSSSELPSAVDPSQDMLYFSTQAQADSYVLQKQVAKLQTRVTRSRGRQVEAAQHCIAALEAPVYKLSDEILAHAFVLGTEGSDDTSFAELVSHVVSRWRRVALVTPRLWAAIRIQATPKSSRPLARLKTLVDRASTLNLRLAIKLEPVRHKHTELAYAGLMMQYVLGSLLSRCVSLDCSTTDAFMSIRVDPAATATSTILKCLSLKGFRDPLRFLSLDNYPSLVELSLSALETHFVNAHSLQHCTLSALRKLVWGITYTRESDLVDIHFPRLEMLEFETSMCTSLVPFFQKVSLASSANHPFPSLQTLCFTKCNQYHLPSLVSFLFSLPSLKHICFSRGMITLPWAPSSNTMYPTSPLWSPESMAISFADCNGHIEFLEYLRDTQSAYSDFKLGSVRIHQFRPLTEVDKLKLESLALKWES